MSFLWQNYEFPIESRTLYFVAGSNVPLHTLLQQHERHEAKEQGVGGLLLESVGMGLGNHLVARHIEHGAPGEA